MGRPVPLVESLERRQLMASAAPLAPAAPAAVASAAITATPNLFAPQRVFLTGNSMTDGLRYNGLAELLGRNGAPVSLGRQTGPGYAQAYNFNLQPGYFTSGLDPARPGEGNPWGNYQQAFAAGAWDAITLQLHDRRLLKDGDPKDPAVTQNQADVPMALAFMKAVAANSPRAQTFIYSRPVRRTDLNDAGQPNGATFDYAAEWLKSYVDTATGANFRPITRSYVTQYMPLLRDAQKADPATANMKPARVIPVGEAFYNVDKMIKAGKFAGTYVTSINDFYVDASHPRGDTGSYLIALAFYASLTGNDPRGVSPPGAYLNPKPGVGAVKVQSLIQQAVFDAMRFSGYAGWTSPMPVIGPQPPTGAGSVRMTVFADADKDGVRDASEGVMSGVKVFMDADNDGQLDAGERSATTNSAGQVTFSNLSVASHRLRVIPATNTRTTSANPLLVSVTAGATKDVRTGLTKTNTASIAGTVFNDANKSAKLDAGDQRLSGRVVFIDADNDNVLDAAERRTTSDAAGSFRFDALTPGTYRIKRVMPTGYTLTTPAATVTLAEGKTFSGLLIGAAKV